MEIVFIMVISMRKIMISIAVVILVTVNVLSQEYKFDSDEVKHIRAFAPNKKSDIEPQVRKCMNVKCKDGYKCFHGRCIAHDNACDSITCDNGFRCVKGICKIKKCKAKKQICLPLNFKLQKTKCTQEFKKECKQNKKKGIIIADQPICGFNPKTQEYHDYYNPCDACLDSTCKIRFFYESACESSPRICSENEECMNGVCTTMFSDSSFDNNESCNSNSDCDSGEYCAAHKCIDKRDLFNYLDSKGEKETILIKVV